MNIFPNNPYRYFIWPLTPLYDLYKTSGYVHWAQLPQINPKIIFTRIWVAEHMFFKPLKTAFLVKFRPKFGNFDQIFEILMKVIDPIFKIFEFKKGN